MSRTPSGLPVAIISKKKEKRKSVTHAVWSGLDCQWAKILRKNKKMSCTPYGLVVAIIGKNKGKIKNVTHAIWSGRECHRAKKQKMKNVMHAIWSGRGCHLQEKIQNKKCHARHIIWPWPASAKKRGK